jgi:zinc D-Ala-D-Ala carboxypeptidase
MTLSPHFKLAEFTQSQTAIRHNLKNIPSKKSIKNLRLLCEHVIEPLRLLVGIPIQISSGYRSPEVNRKIGGSKSSQHMEGKAADLLCPQLGALGLFKTIVESTIEFDQLIYEGTWVQVSYNADKANRMQLLLADFTVKPTKYKPLTKTQALALKK